MNSRLYFVIRLLVELKSAFWILRLKHQESQRPFFTLHFVSAEYIETRIDAWFVCNFHRKWYSFKYHSFKCFYLHNYLILPPLFQSKSK